MKLWVILFLSLSLPALAQTHQSTEIMTSIQRLYNQRFNNHGYIEDSVARQKFIDQQNLAVQKMKSLGFVKRFFKVYNNAKSDIIITVSLVQEPGYFAGLMIERSRYDGAIAAEKLRFFTIPILLAGMSVYTMDGADLIRIQSPQLNHENGGSIFIRYPTNVKNHTFEQGTFQVAKTKGGDFSFFTMEKTGFSRVDLDIWFNIFTQNFGVENFTMK